MGSFEKKFAGKLENKFSWSKSRHGTFCDCLRSYWLHYYGSWGGWDLNSDPQVRERYILKTLSTRQQWAGKVVHDVIQNSLERMQQGFSPKDVSPEATVETTHALMRQQFSDSRKGFYRTKSPKKFPGLVEHELALQVTSEEWRQNWENAQRCLRNFFAMGWLQRAAEIPREKWLPVDALDTFKLEDTTVYAAPDYAYFQPDRLVIVDWKTGSHRQADERQVQCYVLFAAQKWGVPVDQIVARLVYLGEGEVVDVSVSQEALAQFMTHFRDSVSRMKACLVDPENNVARPEEDFPKAESDSTCRTCRFRRLCGLD